MPEKPIGLGLIGCGAFGQFCLENYSRMDGIRIRAVTDVYPEAAGTLAKTFGCDAVESVEVLLGREDVNLVHVATPPVYHYDLVLRAVRAGKSLLCEKPLAMNRAQAEEMLVEADRAGVICPVNFVLRYNAVTEAVKAVIDSGLLGEVLSGRLTNCATDTHLPASHWFWDKAVSGGIFIEHGVHFFDLYRYWLGEAEILDAVTLVREGSKQEDRVMCTLRYQSGAPVSHYHGFDQLAPMDRTDHRLVCELGDIRVEGWIPLKLTVDAALNEASLEKLQGLCPGAEVDILERFEASGGPIPSRGKPRDVTMRARLDWVPEADKTVAYSAGVRDLLADQVAYLRDRGHPRVIDERNGLEAVVLAEKAARLAEGR